MFEPITIVAILRSVQSQGFSRCGGTFAPLHKDGTVACVQRKVKKLGWAISREATSWAYDVLGAMSGIITPAHGSAN